MCGGVLGQIENYAKGINGLNGWNGFRDALEETGTIAGNYELPGSAILSDQLVSKGAQNQLGSGIGQLAQLGSGLAGAGVGSGLTGISQSAGGAAEANALSNLANSTGLSSLYGGTSQGADSLTADYNGITSGAPASADTAVAASTPNFSLGNTLTTGGGSALSTGGGTLGTGGTDALAGESIAAPSASGIGGEAGFSQVPNALSGINPNVGYALDGGATATAAPAQLSGAGWATDVGTNPFTGANAFQTLGSESTPVSASNGGFMNSLSNLFNGNNGISAGASTFNSAGNIVGTGAPAAPASSSGGLGGSALNGLIKGGLGYLFNNPNNSGKNAIQDAMNAAQANYAPYLAAGNQAEGTLANLYGNNGTAAQSSAFQNFQNTPGYQFALQQGLNAVNANAAAMGSPLSGNNQQAVNNYAQGVANQTYNNYVNQLQNMASGGANAATGVSNAGLTGAGGIAQIGQNNANNQNTAIGTGLASLFPSGLTLEQILGKGTNNNNSGLLSLFQ